MSKLRNSNEYIEGVNNLLSFAKDEESYIRCPCRGCGNLHELTKKEVRNHLFRHGIDKTYVLWRYHGERHLASDFSSVPTHENTHQPYNTESPLDETPLDATNMKEMAEAVDKQYKANPEKFQELLEDAETPLYEGCTKITKLSAIVTLFNLKAKGGWTDTSFTNLLKALGEMLPEGNLMPSSMHAVRRTLSIYGMKYEKIHACPNDCILYRGDENKNRTTCPTCGVSRYKENKNGTDQTKGVPAKVLWYFPPIARFKKMFQSAETAKSLTWHANERLVDEKLRHPADSQAWKLVDKRWPEFGAESRNLRLALSADGVNPYNNLSSKYSLWPVMLVTYNLPPWLCMKRKFMMLTMLISGPKQPGKDIDVYLAPLIDDLITLWNSGVEVFDAYKKESFLLKAVLLWTINDLPAYGNLSGCTVKGYFACPVCAEDTSSYRLKHCGKNVYTSTRRFLSRHHPYRKQQKAFNGEKELREAPERLNGQQVRSKVEGIKVSWGKKKSTEEVDKGDNGVMKCWNKKSIFFDLPYWEYSPLPHNFDVMHIEKNVCDSVIGTLLNIPNKTKDHLKSRLDLQEMGLRMELAPKVGEKRTYLPPACYTLSKAEKTRVCKTLHELKVPEGYSSNFKPLVSMQDLKLHGLKSHDCHMLMQQLLPVAIRSVLPSHVRNAIIRLCRFFKDLCARVVDVKRLPEIQNDIVITLCLLEKYFPPSFFDIMVHLPVHLVREVEVGGPVFFRWMYAFERYIDSLSSHFYVELNLRTIYHLII